MRGVDGMPPGECGADVTVEVRPLRPVSREPALGGPSVGLHPLLNGMMVGQPSDPGYGAGHLRDCLIARATGGHTVVPLPPHRNFSSTQRACAPRESAVESIPQQGSQQGAPHP
jgi:hypothetical protein